MNDTVRKRKRGDDIDVCWETAHTQSIHEAVDGKEVGMEPDVRAFLAKFYEAEELSFILCAMAFHSRLPADFE